MSTGRRRLKLLLNPDDTSGQTLLEVIIALSLIILFLSGIVVVELFAIRNTEYAQNKSVATKLARQQIERARVVRDSAGIQELWDWCRLSCYINNQLTPVPADSAPTGTFTQTLTAIADAQCLPPGITITPLPTGYRVFSRVSWAQTGQITPAPMVEVSSCLTNWR